MIYGCYSFLTKSAKLKPLPDCALAIPCYSFLTKSAKLKPYSDELAYLGSYSFLTKSAKLKPNWHSKRTTSKL